MNTFVLLYFASKALFLFNSMNDLINFLKTRRSTTAKTMISGHIKESDLNNILACGIRVPDHGALNPWFLTVIKDSARSRMGKEILAPEFIINNPEATAEEIDFEKNRFLRASVVIAILFKPVTS
jgi:nitroreductase